MPAKKSIMMDQLYGQEVATAVYNRCQELGNDFNTLVQEYVYDIFWARSGLSLKEKSLITIISLIALNKAEQLQIHLKGFFHQGGTVGDIKNIADHMLECNYIASTESVMAHLNALAENQSLSKQTTLSNKDTALIDLASRIALGDNHKTETCMRRLLESGALSREDVENTMLHQIIYCGFPCAMNGYAVLKNIEDVAHTSNQGK